MHIGYIEVELAGQEKKAIITVSLMFIACYMSV